MEKKFVKTNRGIRITMSVICLYLSLSAVTLLLSGDPFAWRIVVPYVALVLLLWVYSLLTMPHVELTENGVAYRYFFRKKVVPWGMLVQVGVMFGTYDRVGEYSAPLIIVLPGGKPRRKKEKHLLLLRNFGRCLMFTRTEESLEFVRKNYGELDFDDFAGLNDWEKKYYESIYRPRKEMKR